MNEDFTIPLNGLPVGKSFFQWQAGKEFLDSFENTEIIDADVRVECQVEKQARYFGVDMDLHGVETVPCDRCLDPLDIKVDETIRLSVKFTSPSSDEGMTSEGGREILCVSTQEDILDLRQIVYDTICLAIPMVKTHPEGECNPDVVRYLSKDEEVEAPEEGNNPFASLKKMLEGK